MADIMVMLENAMDEYLNLVKANKEDLEVVVYPSPRVLFGTYCSVNKGKVIAAPFSLGNIVIASLANDEQSYIIYNGRKMHFDASDLNGRKEETFSIHGLLRGLLAKLYIDKNITLPKFNIYVRKADGLVDDLLAYMLIDTLNRLFLNNNLKEEELLNMVNYACSNYAYVGCDDYLLNVIHAKSLVLLDYARERKESLTQISDNLERFDTYLININHHYLDSKLEPHQKMLEVAKAYGKNNLRELNYTDFVNTPTFLKLDSRSILNAQHFYDEQRSIEDILKELAKNNVSPFLSSLRHSAMTSFSYLNVIHPDTYVLHTLNNLNSFPNAGASLIGDEQNGYIILMALKGKDKEVVDYVNYYLSNNHLALIINNTGIIEVLNPTKKSERKDVQVEEIKPVVEEKPVVRKEKVKKEKGLFKEFA